MKKSYPPRPDNDFRITCFAWSLKHEIMRCKSGFPPLPEGLLLRRFWQYLSFLQENKLTTKVIVHAPNEITDTTSLQNSDLSDLGYLFAQRYNDRWAERAYKDTGEANEERFLANWLAQLKAQRVVT